MASVLRFRSTLTSGVITAVALLCIVGTSHAGAVPFDVMLINAKTGKCATIAGGVSMDNNVESVQFDCDSDPSRRWRLNEMSNGVIRSRMCKPASA